MIFAGQPLQISRMLSCKSEGDLLPKKVVHSKREKESKIKKRSGRRNEEEQLHRGADRFCVEAGGTGYADLRGMPETRYRGADVLPLVKLAQFV